MSMTFYGAGPGFGLPDPSPFVMKSEVHLKMAGVRYTFARGLPPEAPKGKIPYIQVGAHRLGDSTFIRRHIEREHNFDFDAGLSHSERAQSWAIERMLEDHLYFALLHYRWLDDVNFEKGPAHFFDGQPDEVRQAARERVGAAIHGHGLGRHTDAEIADLGGRSLAALSDILGDKPHVMGETASGVDATAFAFAAGVLTPFFTGELRRQAERHENLSAYVARMMETYYPKFAWGAEAKAA